MTACVSDYHVKDKALIEELEKPRDPKDNICLVVNLKINLEQLTGFHREISRAFKKVNHNDKAKVALLCKALSKLPRFLWSVVVRCTDYYRSLKKLVSKIYSTCCFLNYVYSNHQAYFSRNGTSFDKCDIICQNSQTSEIESVVDALAASIAKLTLHVRQKTETPGHANPEGNI